MQRMRELLKSLADYFNKHWILKILVLFMPTIWTPVILKIWGTSWKLSDEKGILTTKGVVFTILVFGIALFINIISSYKSKKEKEREQELQNTISTLKGNISICETVMQSIYDICDSKYDTLLDYMDTIETTKECEKPFLSTVKPTRQLKAISDELVNCFRQITGIKRNEVLVSMAYSIGNDNSQWNWVDYSKLHGCAKLPELIDNQRTTFYQVYSGAEEFVFYNSKIEAEKQGKYVFDQRDKSHKNIGSIICKRIEVGSGSKSQGTIILSISSYGDMFVRTGESLDNVENTIRNIVLKQFEKRICIELSDLYIKEYYSKYKSNRGPTVSTVVFNVEK